MCDMTQRHQLSVSKALRVVTKEIASSRERVQEKQASYLRKRAKMKSRAIRLMKLASDNFKVMVETPRFKEMLDKLFFDHRFNGIFPSKWASLFEVSVIHCQFSTDYCLSLEKDLSINFRSKWDDDSPIDREVLDEDDALPQIIKILKCLLTPEGVIRYLLQKWEYRYIYFPEVAD